MSFNSYFIGSTLMPCLPRVFLFKRILCSDVSIFFKLKKTEFFKYIIDRNILFQFYLWYLSTKCYITWCLKREYNKIIKR